MSQQREPVSVTSWLTPALGHALIVMAMLVRLVVFMPRQKRLLDEYNMALPAFSDVVIIVSMWLSYYWYAILIPVVLLLVLNAVILWRLGGLRRRPGWLWTWGVGGALLSLWAVFELAYLLPMMKLYEALGREP